MEKGKISKTKQMALDRQNKRSFRLRVFSMVLQMLGNSMAEAEGKTMEINIAGNNYSRYIRLSKYGQSCKIKIYADGNVAIELKEFFHEDYYAQLFAFTVDENAQLEFETQFKKTLSWLLPTFWGMKGYGIHEVMDYLDSKTTLEEVHELLEEGVGGSPKEPEEGNEENNKEP